MNPTGCFLLFSVILLQLSIAYFSEAVTNITTDRTALLVLKDHITADPHSFLANNWTKSASVCSWQGVTCGRGRVIELNLSSMSLAGVIPGEIGSLTMLQKLNLENNGFTGILPNEIGNLNKMENMTISHNFITGSIPRRIGNCTSLKEINFDGNAMSGKIPPEIGALRHLEILRIRDNLLVGNIPSALFNISTLKVISAQSNNLTGGLPLTPGLQLPNLEELYFGGNLLDGSLSPFISNASNLTSLDLSYNSFSGAFPATLGNLRFLQVLNFAYNNMAWEIPESSVLSSFTNCQNLRKLTLSGNSLNDTLASIGNFSATLEEFSASNCNLKGNIPREIENLINLISLSLENNELTGTIPSQIGILKQLQGLGLQGNHLQGTIPNDLCNLESLGVVNLGGNKLVGPVPHCFGDLMSLTQIDLSSNKLTSTLPSTLWSLKILSINVSSNFLGGSLPLLAPSKVAKEIDLSNNQFSGGLDLFYGFTDLVFLSVANNKFTGAIPDIHESIGLEVLDLSNNNLSGEIPESFVGLKYLRYFNVSFNELSGEIPDEGPFRNFSAQSYLMNKAFCGAKRLHVPRCKDISAERSVKDILFILRFVPIIAVVSLATSLRISLWWTRIDENEQDWAINDSAAKRFSFQELKHATDSFSEGNLLAHGGFSLVYRGTLQDSKVVAIKVFDVEEETSQSCFLIERTVMHNAHHRNLIRILFSYSNTKFKALVMEYMSNGTLEKWLHTNRYHLDIHKRLDIMIDTASAIKYLHDDFSGPVVHCDLKPSNILLDEDMIAHVSDFGSAKILNPNFRNSTRDSAVMYTFGYAAPEYGLYGTISTKTDVYSFGILLMEMFTGKKPTSEMFYGEMSLRRWVTESFPDEVDKVADQSLTETKEGHINAKKECIQSVLRLALWCSSESHLQRPDMKEVEVILNRIKDGLIKNISRD